MFEGTEKEQNAHNWTKTSEQMNTTFDSISDASLAAHVFVDSK